MRRAKKVPGPKTTDPIGGDILRQLAGSHDAALRHGAFRTRIYRPCEKCDATSGSRCLNLDMLPTRVFMTGFHRGR